MRHQEPFPGSRAVFARGCPWRWKLLLHRRFSSPILRCTKTYLTVPRGNMKQQNPSWMRKRDKKGTNGDDANCWWWSSLATWSRLIKVSAFSRFSPNPVCWQAESPWLARSSGCGGRGRREGEAAVGTGAGRGEAKATNTRDAPGAHHSICPFGGLLHTPPPAVQVWALGGGNSLLFAFWRWTAGTSFASRAARSVLVSLLGWNAPFLSFSLSCSEISTPIPLQSSVTACFIFPLSALCFDPLIRGLGFYLEDICLRCLE